MLLKSAAMDGRFLVFAITDDRKNKPAKKNPGARPGLKVFHQR
jgi:hypothetical protein